MTINNKCWERLGEKVATVHHSWECKTNIKNSMETSLKKLKIELAYD